MTAGDVAALRVIRGDATAEEVAAIVTVLTARLAARERADAGPGAASGVRPRPPRSGGWCDRSRLLGGPVIPRPGGWRASALPD